MRFPILHRVGLVAVCCVLLSAGVGGSVATAASKSPALTDCALHGRLTHHYSAAELRHALATMDATTREYTDCYDVINVALNDALGGAHGTGSASAMSGGSFLPTPVIVVLIVLLVGAGGFIALALRRRRT